MKGAIGCMSRSVLQRTMQRIFCLVVRFSAGARFAEEDRFDKLDVVGAELLPEEVIGGDGGLVEGVVGEMLVDVLDRAVEQGEDPAVFQGESIDVEPFCKGLSGERLRCS